ncbi:2-C-methyl-D-erythritol 2,4-cyclodiphosphate synthase [Opitutia bacterium KCR 482]|nr:2-C-methyl-D-erythritol 2,4-cyclodiphosphate synthase [Opitutae bacterium KCR 482]MDY5583218.1 2-C-methyl-D-erythritol 2,4-cyclodiphosphate synthase [Candidatus Merdousia sp.]
MECNFRIGHGYDVHRLVEGRKCIIGGVEIPSKLGLLGHSDADVLTHALADSILGALALPDIGFYFPPSDPNCEGIDSQEILKKAVAEADRLGYKVANVDCSIIAETPKILPHVAAMKKVLAKSLGVSENDVGVKATTNEKMGWEGEKQGIGVHAVSLLCKK